MTKVEHELSSEIFEDHYSKISYFLMKKAAEGWFRREAIFVERLPNGNCTFIFLFERKVKNDKGSK